METTEIPETTEICETIETPEITELPAKEPEDTDFVAVKDYLPDVLVELKYATADNFTGHVIYEFQDVYLRYGTVKKLASAWQELQTMGLNLKIWDGFRPVSAQFKLWEVYPDPTYVANPEKGYSNHSRGNAVDLTLVDADGNEIEMPTEFDDFSGHADRDYSDCTQTAAENAMLLQTTMEKYGFAGYYGEWWHFSDTEKYDVEKCFDPSVISQWYADCNEFISLRTAPDTGAEVITRILVNEEFTLLGYDGDFAMVDYRGQRGYVLASYISPVTQTEDLACPTLWAANCAEYISLRKTPGGAEVLAKISAGERMELRNWNGDYALVSYGGLEGYVLTSYIKPANDDFFGECLDTVAPTAVYSYDQMMADIAAFQAAYPDMVSTETIGTSELGKEIPVLRIGDPHAEKQVLLQGAIHGREHMTAWLLMAMADYWLDHDLLDYGDACYHIIPMSNPDGVVISQTGSLTEAQTAIYRRDKELGNTALSAKEYAALWKANGLGVDINRNFPAGWETIDDRGEPSSQQYRGEAPFSAAEARALRDYTMRYAFDVTISYHASGNVIYYDYGEKKAVNESAKELANAVKGCTGYGLESSSGVDGAGYKDWAIDALEIPSLTIEVGCQAAPLAEREIYSIFARNISVLPTIVQWL